jgi:hypothetical protein
LIDEVPPLDLHAKGYSPVERGRFHQEFVKHFEPILFTLERLVAEFLLHYRVPNPKGCTGNKGRVGTPTQNLLDCYDLCPACVSEARQAFMYLDAQLNGRSVQFPIPVTLIKERLAAHRQERALDARRKERSARSARATRPKVTNGTGARTESKAGRSASPRKQGRPRADPGLDQRLKNALESMAARGLTHSELAKLVGCSESDLKRARARLRSSQSRARKARTKGLSSP